MLKLVQPSRKYLKSFLKVIDDYKKDDNHSDGAIGKVFPRTWAGVKFPSA